jgi:hypothetical protein
MSNASNKPEAQDKPDASSKESRVASPAATGGAGTFFEQNVGAYWLAQLLVGGIPPILIDCSVVEVHFQTEHLGWHTDDFLIVGQSGPGKLRKLAGQVKRTFAVSAIDEDCKNSVQDFWRDFKNPDRFSPLNDRFAIVTQRGTNTLLGHFSGLLDCARAAVGGGDFEHRLATAGFISAKAVHYCEEIRAIVGELEQRAVSAAELWPFLRVLHVLSLDLGSATRQTEATIKSLLAHTTTDQDPIDTATNSWNALLAVVGDAMPFAGTFRRDNLPESLQQRHASPTTDQRMLAALKDHTAIILGGIRSTVGSGPHLPRTTLVQQVIGKLDESQVVLLSGPAGTGKSAIAKDVVGVLSKDYFVFCFRAEEFAYPHFDATLHNGQIPGRAVTLGAVLASQDRKVLLIESIERLLEKSTRDAFTDLLTLAANDGTLRIILTCRDYSADLVRSCFLQSAAIGHSVVEIPALSDDELAEVESVHPALSVPLAKPALRHVLRNPYILDKALRIEWSADRPLPESERDFRALFWQEIVRAEHRMGDGMPMRRELAFSQIALRRARALGLYVNCSDLDPVVITGLRTDSLLVSSEQNDKFVAPAHDVLEDWAILRWIEEQHATSGGSFRELFEAIGTHPALRRGYRKWVSELIEYDPTSADRLFRGAVADVSVPASFRDDTLVSLLRAHSSPAFLQRHEAELLANRSELLRRVIHLLRVACVTTPAWLKGKGALFNVPDGQAWAAVLRLVHTNLQQFGREDSLLLLGLIEDWARGVSAWAPYPEGAKLAAAIAYSLLPGFDNYSSGDERKRTLQVTAKIPNGDRERFERLLRGEHNNRNNRRNRLSAELQDIIFAGMEGIPAARDVPDVLVSVLRENVLCTESDLRGELGYPSSLELEIEFGLKPGLRHDYFPASAYRTPVLPLLRHHFRMGLDFLIQVFNHSAEWYAHPRVKDRIEPPFEMEMKFGAGSSQKQWCNPRLWNWYRGTSVGPYILQSYLMALERWLMEFAKAQPTMLDSVLLDIMRRSESGALTAVVASVATAFPFQAGETLLTILRSPMCILLDRQRLVSESHATSSVFDGLMQNIRAENRIYQMERKDADSLPHRRSDLETAMMNLQVGPLTTRVQEVLDENRRALPPIAEQDEGDRIWRLAMHRMDLRQYSVREDPDGPPLSKADASSSSDREQKYVRFEPNDPEPDVKNMIDGNAPRFASMQAKISLLMWGLKVFQHEDIERFDPNGWRRRLEEARTVKLTSSDEAMGAQGGPGIIVAVCVRDHWKEMTVEEQAWCIERVCSEILRDVKNWNYMARAQRFDMSADRACAWVVSALVDKPMSEEALRRVHDAFVVALTHPTDEVRWYATWGIAEQLWSISRDLTLRCVNAIATEANIILDQQRAEDAKTYDKRRPHEEIAGEAANIIRQRFWSAGSMADDAYAQLDAGEWFGMEANNRILAILGKAPTETAAIASFTRAARTLADLWNADHDRDEPRRQRNYEGESALSRLVQQFVMRISFSATQTVLQPVLDAVDRHEREVHSFVQGLIGIEDVEPNTAHFWAVWNLFADRVKRATWLPRLDDRYSTGSELTSAMFLGTWWKDNVRHWRSLEGNAHHLHSLFESLPASSTVLDNYVRFLYHVGEQSLPESFIRIAKRLKAGDAKQMLSKGNTVFMLEVLLQRYVYAKPLELKRDHELRDAVLFLLDQLVENGSSASFRMRDDFVTPVSVG